MASDYQPARSINGLLPKILKPVLEKRGFPALALVAQWREIAGGTLAAHAVPDRVSWPRRKQPVAAEDEDRAARNRRRKPGVRAGGATLRLRVDPVMALEVEYQKAQILDRINTFFGYQAVTTLKIIQGPVNRPQSGSRAAAAPLPVRDGLPDLDLTDIEDEKLRQALARLNICRRQR